MHRYRRGMSSLAILEKDLGRITGYKLNASCVGAEKQFTSILGCCRV